MELINATRMTAGYNMGLEPSGRELLVVVIKGTFVLPKPGEEVRLSDEQLPLVMADTFTGEPGFSAPRHEVDFAPRKHACDVLLVGNARAPQDKQVTRMRVGVRVGSMSKNFDVIGNRFWESGATGVRSSAPQPFISMPVSYDVAFGGVDRLSKNESEHAAYMANPVGRGWHKDLDSALVDGTPLPNTEEIGIPTASPNDKLNPMALGPLGRSWSQRAPYAGTYDKRWLDDVFPFLPEDFDERYYQAAPLDQQLPRPNSPVEVTLIGLTADGARHFLLPHFSAPVHVFEKRRDREDLIATLDTIVIEPDNERFTMTWRVARPLKKSIHEIAQVLVGKKSPQWWLRRQARTFPIPVVMVPMQRGNHADAKQRQP
jgi:hypothetical protein